MPTPLSIKTKIDAGAILFVTLSTPDDPTIIQHHRPHHGFNIAA